MGQSFSKILLIDGIAQGGIKGGASSQNHAGDQGVAAGIGGFCGLLKGGGHAALHLVEVGHIVQINLHLGPLHRPQTHKIFAAGKGAVRLRAGRNAQAAARPGLVDVQALSIAAVGDKGLGTQRCPFVYVPQRPGVEAGVFEVVQRAGGVAVGLALPLNRAVQHAQLKALVLLAAPEHTGKVAAFLYLGMADAVYHGHHLAVFFNRMAFGIGPENGDIVGPLQRPDTNPLYLDIQLTSAQPLFVPIPVGHNAFVYVVQGQPHVAGQTIAPRRMAILSNDSQANGVLLQGQAGDQLLVLSGQPLGEPIVQWGPFVMNTRSEIEQAISDYQSGQL